MDFVKTDRLTISPESLWKLIPKDGKPIPAFDLVIIDEIEAVQRQFNGST